MSGAAQTAVTDSYVAAGTQPVWQWSNAMSLAALEYVNSKGTTGTPTEASIFLTARNKYCSSVCSPKELEYTHTLNTEASWDAQAQMDTWFQAGNFNDADLKDTTYTHVGIACSCDNAASGVRCVFMFSKYFIGKEITDSAPKFLPYTAAPGACASTPTANLFTPSACAANQYSDGACKDCTSRILNCQTCSWSESAHFQVICSLCDTGYHEVTMSNGGKLC